MSYRSNRHLERKSGLLRLRATLTAFPSMIFCIARPHLGTRFHASASPVLDVDGAGRQIGRGYFGTHSQRVIREGLAASRDEDLRDECGETLLLRVGTAVVAYNIERKL